MEFVPRSARQRHEDRQVLAELVQSEAWVAVVRSLRERQYLHALTLSTSPAETPEQAFVLVHRQQALIADMEQFQADPVAWLLPDLPDQEEEDSGQ